MYQLDECSSLKSIFLLKGFRAVCKSVHRPCKAEQVEIYSWSLSTTATWCPQNGSFLCHDNLQHKYVPTDLQKTTRSDVGVSVNLQLNDNIKCYLNVSRGRLCTFIWLWKKDRVLFKKYWYQFTWYHYFNTFFFNHINFVNFITTLTSAIRAYQMRLQGLFIMWHH